MGLCLYMNTHDVMPIGRYTKCTEEMSKEKWSESVQTSKLDDDNDDDFSLKIMKVDS